MKNININLPLLAVIVAMASISLRDGAFDDPAGWLADKILLMPAVIIGIAVHEFAHAAVAYKLGDNTPKLQGRVTINPLAHIDWIGLTALFFCGFGWGRAVQINPFNFRHRRRDELFVSLAGVVMNLITAAAFALIAKLFLTSAGAAWITETIIGTCIWTMLIYVIQINLVLMIFNLIPCPPLDGFSIIAEIFGFGQTETYWKIYRYGDWILVALIIFGITGMVITPCVNFFMEIFWTFVL